MKTHGRKTTLSVPPSIQEKRVVDGNAKGKPETIGKPDAENSFVSQGWKAETIANQPKEITTITQLNVIDRMKNQKLKI